ncbi:hypothetical protein IQ268_19015 [Oculatella sp. LEGE 06141]|uniref:hypothetical protein n=1 Tax=Oculatella sp. LEGE 06141 TaxID=1828648 RepID=UPI001881CC07|nr:hypothetical protein [Oculatella sp. LEGE 06141]MBE9180655.1 hypothetical protein [Oculatella sp. LEGE 06141]
MKALNLSIQLMHAYETVFLPRREASPSQRPNRWMPLWHRFIAGMSGTAEPHVWQETDRYGQLLWRAYDPRNGRSFTSDNESEMRSWIEQRYYA